MLVDVGPTVGYDHPAAARRWGADLAQALRPEPGFPGPVLAVPGPAVRVRSLGRGHGLSHVVLLVKQRQ